MFEIKQNASRLHVLYIYTIIIYWSNVFYVRCDNITNQNDTVYKENGGVLLEFIHTSMPMRIYECLSNNISVLRCAKLFLLCQLDDSQHSVNSGNLRHDVFQQFFNMTKPMTSLINLHYKTMTDKEIDIYLKKRLQQYFRYRNIQLQLLPNFFVNIKSEEEDKLSISLKQRSIQHIEKDNHGRADSFLDYLNEGTSTLFSNSNDYDNDNDNDNDDDDGAVDNNQNKEIEQVDLIKTKSKHSKNKIKKGNMNILEMAVPVMFMPAILMGTFLPFWLPFLKMATLTTLLMNNAAFISAVVYALRTHINNQEQQHFVYNYDHSTNH